MSVSKRSVYKWMPVAGIAIFTTFVPSGVVVITTTHGNLIWGYAIVGFGILGALIAIYGGVKIWESEETEHRSTITLQRRPRQRSDSIILDGLKIRMGKDHGAVDHIGIEEDYYEGYDTEDILTRKCLVCKQPRNKQKGLGHE